MSLTGKTILTGARGVLKINGVEVADLQDVSLNEDIETAPHRPCGAWEVQEWTPLGYTAGMSATVKKRRGIDQVSRGWKPDGVKSFIEMSEMTATIYDTADESNVYKAEGVRYAGFSGGISAGAESSEAYNFVIRRLKEETEV